VEVTRKSVDFRPITVSFVIESTEELRQLVEDFHIIGTTELVLYDITDNLIVSVAELKDYLED